MSSREQFEAHFPWTKDELCRNGERYLDDSVQFNWLVWRASRKALEIELPASLPSEKPYACYEGGWNDMRGEAVDAIEAAGVRVKTCS